MGESPMKDRYYFGRSLAVQVDYYAFPRTGSHFLRYCTQGLFDLVAFEHEDADHAEAIARQSELDPHALYALDLREDGAAHEPVQFNARVSGRHGQAVARGHPIVVLIRHPIATVYSYHRVMTTRWKPDQPVGDVAGWITRQLGLYAAFYDEATEAMKSSRSLLIRYEELVASAEPLEKLVALVGVGPKLKASFVHEMTRFDRFVRAGERSFYRAGRDDAWREDEDWCRALERSDVPDLKRFGYGVSPGKAAE